MTAYGAIPTTNPTEVVDPEENSFEEYDVDYVQERKLTRKERINKILTAGLPILVAFLIIGGFGWFTSKAVAPRHDYSKVSTAVPAMHPISTAVDEPVLAPHPPPSAPSPTQNTTPKETSPPAPKASPSSSTASSSSSTTSSSISSSSGGGGATSCSANSKCKALGLTGECCPTNDGTQLGCCN